MFKAGITSVTALGSVVLLGIGPAGAQTAVEPQSGVSETVRSADKVSGTGEIVVTARRREERLQDVPVAVSVLGGDLLQRQNITSMTEFQKSVPSLTIMQSNGRGNSANIMLRGQRQGDNTIFADPSVQVYINEVNAPRTSGLDTTAFDLESVQVLKGPQGTLFGRNSTGGAVLFTTRKPGDTSSGYIRTYFEDPLGAGIEAAGDLPIAEGVALRLAGTYQYRRGFTRVVDPGALLNTAPFNAAPLAGTFGLVNRGQNLDDKNRWAGRATLDLNPSDSLRSTFVVEAFEADENGVGTYIFNYRPGFSGSPTTTATIIGLGTPQAVALAESLGFHETTSSVRHRSNYTMLSASNVTTLKLNDQITLKNIVGYRKVKGLDVIDQDGSFVNINANAPARNGGEMYSEELQLQGDSLDGDLDWVLGGYYFRETGYDDVETYTFRMPSGNFTNNNYQAINKSLSAFLHFNYTLPFIASRTRVYGGIRYTHDKRTLDFRSRSVAIDGTVTCSVFNDAGVRLPGTACTLKRSTTFNEPTFELGIDHQWMPNSLLYATFSTGYRAGGFNGRAVTIAQRVPFRPEKVKNYEVGAKNSVSIGAIPVTLNLAAYYTDYKDIQRTVIIDNRVPGTVAPVVGTNIVNAAAARIYGFEGEFSARLLPSFTVRAHASYVNARYNSFPETNPVTGVTTDRSNNGFFGVPELQWGAGFDWTALDSETGEVVLSANASHIGSAELNDINVPGGRSSSYTLVDAFLNWNRMFGSGITTGIYVKNLFDKNYIPSGLLLTSAFDVAQVQHGAPRLIGAMVRMDF